MMRMALIFVSFLITLVTSKSAVAPGQVILKEYPPAAAPEVGANECTISTLCSADEFVDCKNGTFIPNAVGDQGDKGDSGVPGDVGEAGDQGPQGPPGANGQDGLDGEKGPTGDPGEVGDRGPEGEAGDTGPQGLPGRDGAEGGKGEKGEPGDVGLVGPVGDQGINGSAGDKGEDGDQGAQGKPGPDGNPGINGSTGDAGPIGLPGVKGNAGVPGSNGSAGPKGDQGLPGSQGEPGVNGTDGDVGDVGNEGPPGPTGDAGDQGPEGPVGLPGPPGNLDVGVVKNFVKAICPIKYTKICFIPLIGWTINSEEATQKCGDLGAKIADVYSGQNLINIEETIRQSYIGEADVLNFRLGLQYVGGELLLSNGTTASNELGWDDGFPLDGEEYANHTNVILRVKKKRVDHKFLFNALPTDDFDVVCEL